MLRLNGITKDYVTADSTVHALRGIDLEFGKCEFVSVLGPSGCGKTTLLNIIGGLDRYTEGDLVIRGKSTVEFKSSDWDSYRNHSVGFVFQTYNLIPHQTVLANVELALTLSGVRKSERRKRAADALKRVGLGDQLKKKPNQLSGGQMQRVAIARALVNDPDIILADEPTGALDSETSVQVMDILKEVSQSRLVIMVTHNSELAEQYSTRIVRLLDGSLVGDERRVPEAAEAVIEAPETDKKTKKPSMSFFTALSLSTKNLLTKKGRTILTSFAGSIGIVGIALILALSNGIQMYIDRVQEDTLSSLPFQIAEQNVDMTGMLELAENDDKVGHELDAVYTRSMAAKALNNLMENVKINNLAAFKKLLDDPESEINKYISSVQYEYATKPNIYTEYTDKKTGETKLLLVNPSDVLKRIYGDIAGTMTMFTGGNDFSVWTEMIDDRELLETQYDVIAGEWPNEYDEIVLIVNENNEISDLAMYALGVKDSAEITEIIEALSRGETMETSESVFQYEDIMNMTFDLVINTDYFVKTGRTVETDNGLYPIWKDMSESEEHIRSLISDGKSVKLKVTGIIRPDENAVTTSAQGAIGYSAELSKLMLERIAESEITKQQLADPDRNVLTGLEFKTGDDYTMDDVRAYIATLPETEQAQINAMLAFMAEEDVLEYFSEALSQSVSYKTVCEKIGISDIDKPTAINIFTRSFEDKEKMVDCIDKYNAEHADDGLSLEYTDYVGVLMSSVSTIISFVSYALIAFVSISLVVSSIMIGIITYISVLERIKEIGILRAMGASKRDISRVFNAETVIVGFIAGAIGILNTLILILPLNLIIGSLSDIWNIASLPPLAAVILVAVSMLLTHISGLIPARMAASKDPVVALRSE